MPTRRFLLASLGLAGCSGPLKSAPGSPSGAQSAVVLARSAAAHGAASLATIRDISVSYTGAWHAFIGSIQPALTDEGFRGASEERLLLRDGVVAQSYTGPRGHKQVFRQGVAHQQGTVRVWYNGEESDDPERLAAAALVADGYSLFLLGPMVLAGDWARNRTVTLAMAELDRLGGRDCQVVRAQITPGIGLSAADTVAMWIDRDEWLMRRVRFTLNGLESTKGAVVDVDTSDHVTLHDMRWPTRFHEGLVRPLPLPVHDWRLTGLDVGRGLSVAEVAGDGYTGRAERSAGTV